LLLYMMVEFIPNLGAYDVAGPQWVYLAVVNMASLIFILTDKDSGRVQALQSVPVSALSLIYGSFVVVAGLSIFAAANKVESLCCYSTVLVTALMFLNIAVLLHRRMHLFPLMAWAISLLLLVQALQVLYKFYEGGQVYLSLDEDLDNIRLNAGHKNILAASMVIKFPFLMYTILKGNLKARVFAMSVFAVAVCGLVILNARSTYVSLLCLMGIYIVYYVRDYSKLKSVKSLFINLGGVLGLFIVGVMLSNALLKHGPRIYDSDFYGTFLKKLGSIKLSNEGSDNRFWLWGNALSYIKGHVLLGCGLGNWKLAAIPYEKDTINELIVSIHVHNDFLETFAETGLLGGLLLVSLFVGIAWLILRTYFQKKQFRLREVAPVLLGIWVCYFVDANLNFPEGRPIMKVYFALMLALCVGFLHEAGQLPALSGRVPVSRNGFGIIGLPIMVSLIVIRVVIFHSLTAQAQFSQDSLQQPPSMGWDDVKDAFPGIPNMDIQCLPIGEIKANYLIKESRYGEALQLLEDCAHVNPNLGYNDYLKGVVNFKEKKTDSAYVYAARAFEKRPRAIPFCKFLLTLCAVRQDKTTADRVFRKVVALNNDSRLWNHYIEVLSVLKVDDGVLFSLTDSALKYFPNDESLKKKKAILGRSLKK
jgi:O-antigen ligase